MHIWGSESAREEGKIFTRDVDDRAFSYPDFAVPVYQKRQRKWTEWKDVGQKMSVPMVGKTLSYIDVPNSDALSVLSRYQ
ncbi:MAG: hypothetical protein H6766_01550 [Candidatus Peribacteria bacterium]|nr:MAG: hypothetical protein H6766_01550 [Candidatus Peribacteria bacterium]